MAPRGIPNKKPAVIEEVPDLDDLLEPDEPEVEEADDVEVEDDDELDEEDAAIAALEAELKKPAPAPKPTAKKSERPIPESKLTPKQKKLRDLQDQVARKKAIELENHETEYEAAEGDDVVVLHFVADGLIAQGQMWYRGQTLAFDRNGLAYEQTKDRNGESWVDLVDDIDGQFERYGKEMFRPGPWRGKSLAEAPVPSEITDPTEIAAYKESLKRAAAAEAARGYAAPIMADV